LHSTDRFDKLLVLMLDRMQLGLRGLHKLLQASILVLSPLVHVGLHNGLVLVDGLL
jgi:hypothetical protein